MKIRHLLFFIFVFLSSQAQNYPKDFFASPLDIPLHISGTFGELRTNHFHSGIDFKTNFKTGLPVYAAAEGFVSRIKIAVFGYGKAIYITHPNGFTTVYAHLEKASPEIEALIQKEQYKEQSYEVEIFLGPKILPIKTRDLIGYSGNSGGSGGPHLHYEFRDTASEEIINPLHFGLDSLIADTKKPFVSGLLVYPISELAVVNKSKKPVIVGFTTQKDGSLLASKIAGKGTIGFGISTFDETDQNTNNNGVYKIDVSLNGKSFYHVQFDRFSFDQSRTINVFIDFERLYKTKQRYQKLFRTHQTSIPVIDSTSTDGLVELIPNFSKIFKMTITDFHGNETLLHIPVKYSPDAAIDARETIEKPFVVQHQKEYIFVKNGFEVVFPEKAFYEDCHLKISTSENGLNLHEPIIPVQNSIVISKEIPENQLALSEKLYLAREVNGDIRYLKNYRKNGKLTIYTKDLGNYLVAIDTIAPKIKPINFSEGQWMSLSKNIQIEIEDKESGIKTFRGFLNNQWVLFEYDFKTNTLTHEFNQKFVLEGKNSLKIEVVDHLGNSTIFETHFFRSQKP
jgi:hypothetical protein